jgi:hypothetical protein
MFSESPRRLKTSNRSRARKEDLPAKDDKGCPLPDCHRRSVNSTPTERFGTGRNVFAVPLFAARRRCDDLHQIATFLKFNMLWP